MLRNGAVTSVRGSVGDAPLSCSSKSKKSPTLFGRNAKCNLGALDGNRLGAAPHCEIRRVFRGYMSGSPVNKYPIKYLFKYRFNRSRFSYSWRDPTVTSHTDAPPLRRVNEILYGLI